MTDTPITHPLSAGLRHEAEGHQTVYGEDRRRKGLFAAAADELDRRAAEIARLRAEVEALRVDAERLDTRAIRLGDTVFADVDLRAAIGAARTPEGRSDG